MIEDVYKRAVEQTYIDKCTVSEYIKYRKENKSTAFREEVKYCDLPCRISFLSKNAVSNTQTFTAMSQSAKLFVSPNIKINPGSKITVTHDGVITEYKQSGFSAVYRTHQEIALVLFDERA